MGIEKKRQDKKEDAAGPAAEKDAGVPIVVHSYSGYKQEERPRSFELEGKRLTVLRVVKSWQEESANSRRRKSFFRVHTHDGRIYDIALDESNGQWTMEPQHQP